MDLLTEENHFSNKLTASSMKTFYYLNCCLLSKFCANYGDLFLVAFTKDLGGDLPCILGSPTGSVTFASLWQKSEAGNGDML